MYNESVGTRGVQVRDTSTTFKFRLPRELLEAAHAKAKQKDLMLSQVLRRCLREWVEDDPPTHKEGDQEDD